MSGRIWISKNLNWSEPPMARYTFWNRKKFAYKLHTNGDRHFTICTKKIAHALIILRFLLAYIRVYFFYTKCYISERTNSTTKSALVKIYFLLRCVVLKKIFSHQLSRHLAEENFFFLFIVLANYYFFPLHCLC